MFVPLLLLAAAGGGGYYFWRKKQPSLQPPAPHYGPAPAPPPAPPPLPPVPGLPPPPLGGPVVLDRTRMDAAEAWAKEVLADLLSRGSNYDRKRMKNFQVAAKVAVDGLYGPVSAAAVKYYTGTYHPPYFGNKSQVNYVPPPAGEKPPAPGSIK